MWLKPFRIIAGDPRRRTGEIGGVELVVLLLAQRCGRIARTIGQLTNRIGIEPALALEHAEQDRARGLGAHDPGARRTPPQRVINEAGNGRAVAGAGKAVCHTPALERIGGWPALALDGGEYLDGSRKTRARSHGRPRQSGSPSVSATSTNSGSRTIGMVMTASK